MEMHEAKAWFILVASFILLVIICTLATLGIFTRPKRWNDRPGIYGGQELRGGR